MRRAADKYRLPTWWLFVICQRESSFDVNATDGKGLGLTQLTGLHHNGMPYPHDLPVPDNTHRQWRNDMGLGAFAASYFKGWIDMKDVTVLTDPIDPDQNLDRFATVHAVPAYAMCAKRYGLSDPAEILRRVASHWKTGIFKDYNPDHPYFTAEHGYDRYEAEFRPKCEAEEGVYVGPPRLVVPDPRIAELEAENGALRAKHERMRLAAMKAIEDLGDSLA